jgi:hypothetical protein
VKIISEFRNLPMKCYAQGYSPRHVVIHSLQDQKTSIMTALLRIPGRKIYHREWPQNDPWWISIPGHCYEKLQEQLIELSRRRVPEVNDRRETREYAPASIPEQDE